MERVRISQIPVSQGYSVFLFAEKSEPVNNEIVLATVKMSDGVSLFLKNRRCLLLYGVMSDGSVLIGDRPRDLIQEIKELSGLAELLAGKAGEAKKV